MFGLEFNVTKITFIFNKTDVKNKITTLVLLKLLLRKKSHWFY